MDNSNNYGNRSSDSNDVGSGGDHSYHDLYTKRAIHILSVV